MPRDDGVWGSAGGGGGGGGEGGEGSRCEGGGAVGKGERLGSEVAGGVGSERGWGGRGGRQVMGLRAAQGVWREPLPCCSLYLPSLPPPPSPGLHTQVCRTTLLPGALKTLGANKENALPIKLFEISDVILLSSSKEV